MPQQPRRPERRTGERSDTGDRRRSDDTVAKIAAWMEAHDDWARDWTARMESRMATVESRADLLDGRAGNDDGLIGKLGELRGEVRGLREQLVEARGDIRDVKHKTGAEDGQEPPSRLEKWVTIALPVLLAVIPTIGVIVAAYLALKGNIVTTSGGK